MKRELEQFVGDALSNPTVQKGAATVTIGSGLTLVFDWGPKIIGLLAALMGLSVTALIRKKTKKEIELLDFKINQKKQKENNHEAQ